MSDKEAEKVRKGRIEKVGKAEETKKTEAAEPTKKEKPKEKHDMRVLVRVLGTDLNGEKAVGHAILRIKGVSHTFAKAVCKAAKIDPKKKLGSFTESEIASLENAIKDPLKLNIPVWILNRRKDIESGKDMHMSSSDVDVAMKFDIQRMVDKKSYKGIRHMLGLPVRGQRTRSSFRRGRTVGVVRKSVRLAAGAGAAKTAGEEKGKEEKGTDKEKK